MKVSFIRGLSCTIKCKEYSSIQNEISITLTHKQHCKYHEDLLSWGFELYYSGYSVKYLHRNALYFIKVIVGDYE